MQALAFWKAITMDRSDMLEDLFAFLSHHHVRFCAIGGVAVNAYAEPVVTLDLDLVLATPDLEVNARLIEVQPGLRTQVPGEILARLF